MFQCDQPHPFDTRRFEELTCLHRQGIRFPDDAVLECIRTPGHVFLTQMVTPEDIIIIIIIIIIIKII